MNYNYIISYDLCVPGQNYTRVQDAIKSLGRWYHLQYSTFYVSTPFTKRECDAIIGDALDDNDKLQISDPHGILVRGISQADIDAINRVWFGTEAARAA